MDRNNLPAVFAKVRHRHWLHALAHHHRDVPDFGLEECPLTHWQKHHGHAHYGTLPVFAELAHLHHELHEIGQTLARAHQRGDTGNSEKHIKTLFSLHEELQTVLHRLMREPGAASPETH